MYGLHSNEPPGLRAVEGESLQMGRRADTAYEYNYPRQRGYMVSGVDIYTPIQRDD